MFNFSYDVNTDVTTLSDENMTLNLKGKMYISSCGDFCNMCGDDECTFCDNLKILNQNINGEYNTDDCYISLLGYSNQHIDDFNFQFTSEGYFVLYIDFRSDGYVKTINYHIPYDKNKIIIKNFLESIKQNTIEHFNI